MKPPVCRFCHIAHWGPIHPGEGKPAAHDLAPIVKAKAATMAPKAKPEPSPEKPKAKAAPKPKAAPPVALETIAAPAKRGRGRPPGPPLSPEDTRAKESARIAAWREKKRQAKPA